MSNKYIYLVFSKTGTMFSNIISFCTKEDYAHVSLSLDDTFTRMYSFGRKIPEKVLPAGFVEENLYSGVFSMFPKSRCMIYKVPVTTEQYNILIDEISNFKENSNVLKYNILGTSLLYINKPRKRENRYFCSEFVSEVLIKSGIYKTNKAPEEILPLDLLEIYPKTLVYEGYIHESKYLFNTLPSSI